MSQCGYCGKEIPRGEGYLGNQYKRLRFCSEDHFEQYCRIKNSPKPPINFKPEQGSERRVFTDYIQEWTDDRVNWPHIMAQAKTLQEEYDLDWRKMYLVCKYARVYEQAEWDFQYGLGQIFPRYIKPCEDFMEAIKANKQIDDVEDEVVIVKKRKEYVGKVEF